MSHVENAIFWIEVDKIVPNPYQPRREFDQDRLKELSESIKQYGVLQPLVVSRKEEHQENGNIVVSYELIAGERRLRASKLAGLSQVPVVVRVGDDSRQKLELAIIENVQREDLNAVERGQSFQRLADEFKLTWADVGRKVGKSREYVSNTVRILMLPQDILDSLSKGLITEGHTRPLLMLIDRPEEQMTLYKEMLIRKMTVREAESIARRIAYEKVRRKSTLMTPEVVDVEEKLAEALGTRVHVEPREKGGRISIEYFSHDEFLALTFLLRQAAEKRTHEGMYDKIRSEDVETLKEGADPYASPHIAPWARELAFGDTNMTFAEYKKAEQEAEERKRAEAIIPQVEETLVFNDKAPEVVAEVILQEEQPRYELDDRTTVEKKEDEQQEDLYNIKNFSL